VKGNAVSVAVRARKRLGYRVPMTTKPDDPDVQHDDQTELEPESDAPAEPGSDDVSESGESAT